MALDTSPVTNPSDVEKEDISAVTNVVDAYPAVPKPATVDCKLALDTSPETYPRDVEKDDICAVTKLVEAYPAVPNPAKVDCRVVVR